MLAVIAMPLNVAQRNLCHMNATEKVDVEANIYLLLGLLHSWEHSVVFVAIPFVPKFQKWWL